MSKLIPQMGKLIPQKLIPQKLIPQQLTPRQLTPHQAQLAGFCRPNELTAEPPIEQYIVRSKIVIGVLFGGFGLWAAFAPLTSAAVAPGVVKVDSYRKTVQHLEGGIVSEILVHEGDAVVQGQPLVRLDDADAEADLNAVGGQIGALEAETSAIKEQLPSFEEQLADERGLFQKGYAKKSQIFELERTVLKMKGDVEANENRLTSLR